MEQSQVMQDVADTVTRTPITLHFKNRPKKKLNEKFKKWGWKEKENAFELRGPSYGTLQRVSKLYLKIQLDTTNGKALFDSTVNTMANQSKLVSTMLAVLIFNREKYAPKSLINFIHYNMDQEDAKTMVAVVLKQLDIETFLGCLVSLRGLNVLTKAETAPIAPGV